MKGFSLSNLLGISQPGTTISPPVFVSIQEEAEESLKNAVLSENAGNLENSLMFYQRSLDLWLEIVRTETDTRRKNEITKLLVEYVEKAENIKRRLENENTSHVNNTTYFSPLTLVPKLGDNVSNKNTHMPHSFGDIPQTNSNVSKKPKRITTRAPGKTSKVSIPNINAKVESPRSTQVSRANKTDGNKPSSARTSQDKLTEYEKQIANEILDQSPGVRWGDISGLSLAKQTLQEAVILPNLRPDLFTGLRAPSRGVLLFGPPGTGKTLLAKAVATESGFSFFSISASSLTSKYVGEGEKLMKTLFEMARKMQPAVIFFDEIDALMSTRKDSEHEASRRLKTEFMVQVDGAGTSSEDRVLIMAATNVPWSIDEAVLRRLPKRIYVPLPDAPARHALLRHLLKDQLTAHPGDQAKGGTELMSLQGVMGRMPIPGVPASQKTKRLSDSQLERVVQLTEGYSGSDLAALCREAAMEPIREMPPEALRTIKAEELRPLELKDFEMSCRRIRPSVPLESLSAFSQWSALYGTK